MTLNQVIVSFHDILVTFDDVLISLDNLVLVAVDGIAQTEYVVEITEQKVISTDKFVIRALNCV